MAKPDKLDRIWSTDTPANNVDPGETKFNTGFVSEKWPFEWANFMFNRLSLMNKELNENGMFLWDQNVTYAFEGITLHNGTVWKCRNQSGSLGVEPGELNSWMDWTVDDGSEVGEIIMFDGTWVDNVTMPGWYACVDGNQDKGCPNLEDRLVFGKGPTGSGGSDGNNDILLADNSTPAHVHSLSSIASSDDSHSHKYSKVVSVSYQTVTGAWPSSGDIPVNGSSIKMQGRGYSGPPKIGASFDSDYETSENEVSHSHVVSGLSTIPSTQNSINIDTKHAKLVFIRKCR